MSASRIRNLLGSSLAMGIAAVAAGATAAWLGARYLHQRAGELELETRERYSPAPYIVASRDVDRGQLIDQSLLAIRSIPRSFAPVDAVAPEAASSLIGARAAIAIRRGTPVVQAALARAATRTRLSETLPVGMRALTIEVDQVNSISGHLAAGDWVDLYYSRARGSGALLAPLMQRVQVLATGDVTQPLDALPAAVDLHEFSSLTLLVSAEDAQRIVLAEQTGRITVLLRRPEDEHRVISRPVDSTNLLLPTGMRDSRDHPRSQPVELLVGGNGGTPARSWLVPGDDA